MEKYNTGQKSFQLAIKRQKNILTDIEAKYLVQVLRRKYPNLYRDILPKATVDMEYICEVCGEELLESGTCPTCSMDQENSDHKRTKRHFYRET